jgi:hypothetical protein
LTITVPFTVLRLWNMYAWLPYKPYGRDWLFCVSNVVRSPAAMSDCNCCKEIPPDQMEVAEHPVSTSMEMLGMPPLAMPL